MKTRINERRYLLPPCRVERYLRKLGLEYDDESLEKPVEKKIYHCRVEKTPCLIESYKKRLKGLNILSVESDSLLPELEKMVVADVTNNAGFNPENLAEAVRIPPVEEPLHTLLQKVAEYDHFLKAETAIEISGYESTAHAIQALIFSLTHTMHVNAKAILEGDEDPERLHQLRVAMRKIRAIFSRFRPFFEKRWLSCHKEALASLMEKSNPIRDVDVYLLKIDDYKSMVDPSYHDGLERLRSYLVARSKLMHERLIEMLESDPFQQEVVSLYEFSKNESRNGLCEMAETPIIFPLKKILKQTFAIVLRKGAKLHPDSDAKAFHEVRIEVKKLRYTLEFFASVFDRQTYEKVVAALKRIQTILGDHQDLVVQKAYIRSLLDEPGLKEKETKKSLKTLIKALEKLERKKRRSFEKAFKKFSKDADLFHEMICRY